MKSTAARPPKGSDAGVSGVAEPFQETLNSGFDMADHADHSLITANLKDRIEEAKRKEEAKEEEMINPLPQAGKSKAASKKESNSSPL